MTRSGPRPSYPSPPFLALVGALLAARCRGAFTAKYCSDFNTAASPDESAHYSDFQSHGLCDGNCTDSAYAIVQNFACWCSDYTPAKSTVGKLGECNEPCPGYPNEVCGGKNKFLYLFRNKPPAGVKPDPSGDDEDENDDKEENDGDRDDDDRRTSSSSSSSSPAAATPESGLPSSTHENEAAADDEDELPMAGVDTSPGGADRPGRLSTGAAVGIAVGSILAVLVVIGLILLAWRKRRSGAWNDPSRRSSAADMISGAARAASGAQTRRGSKFMPVDQRMEFHPDIYARAINSSSSRESLGSLRDDVDYSRRVLRTTNPDPS